MTKEDIQKIIKDEFEIYRKEMEYYRYLFSDRVQFRHKIKISDAQNLELGRTTGTKIGTDILEKLAFYGQTPVDRPVKVDDPAGGATVDSPARTAIEAIIARLEEIGLIAPN